LKSRNRINIRTADAGYVRCVRIGASSQVQTLDARRHAVLESVNGWEITWKICPKLLLNYSASLEGAKKGDILECHKDKPNSFVGKRLIVLALHRF
jgi:hypothetical protein